MYIIIDTCGVVLGTGLQRDLLHVRQELRQRMRTIENIAMDDTSRLAATVKDEIDRAIGEVSEAWVR